jgi:hypothetical protein
MPSSNLTDLTSRRTGMAKGWMKKAAEKVEEKAEEKAADGKKGKKFPLHDHARSKKD